MSKLSFRARALDASKPMPIYLAEELPDLPDFSAINRAVPQMPSGMQKEEECEHHLQRAICAGIIIPTPEVTDVPLKDFYDKIYPANYKQPRQLIHMQPFTMEQDIPDYDMDSDDERWLQSQKPRLDITPLKFEEMMDRLEKSSGQTVVTLAEAKALLKEDDELTIAVFDYWLNKRLKTQHPLILTVRTEQRLGIAANNPYLAFRRRTEKMQTRKNRKNDEVSYEKMLKLRRDLVRAVTLLELVKRREKCKREFVHLTVEVFEKRFQARDFSGAVEAEAAASKAASAPQRPAFTPIFHNHYPNQSWVDAVASQVQATAQAAKTSMKDEVIPRREKRQYKKRKHKSIGGRGLEGLSSDEEGSLGAPPRGTTPEPEEQEDDGPFAFRRNRLCSYHKPLPAVGNWPWCSKEENGAADNRFRFTLTSLSNPKRCVGFARRRLGRGGRIILDRVGTDYDDLWRGLDFSIIEPAAAKPKIEAAAAPTSDSLLPLLDPLVKTESSLRTSDGTATYNKFSAVSSGAQQPVLLGSDVGSFATGSSDFFSNSSSVSGSYLTSDRLTVADVKVECKTEPMDEDEDAEEVKLETKEEDEDDQEDMVKFLRALRRDWLHFRPKTPPPEYEPPCHLLPPEESPFANNALPPFHMEVETLDPPSSTLLLDQSPFVTDLFELDRRWSEDDSSNLGSSHFGPQEPLFEDSDLHDEVDDCWRTVGVSSFTLTDAGGEALGSRRSAGGADVTDAGIERVAQEGKGDGCGAGGASGEQQTQTEVGSTNGIISSQIGFVADVPSSNRSRNNKLPTYAYSNTHSNPGGTLSLLTSAQSVTLNSHSANNLLEFPLTAAVDVEVEDSGTTQGTDVSSGPAQKAPNSGVRNNKSTLVMEVT